MNPRFEFARLDDASLNMVRSLEQDLQSRIVALRPKGRRANLSPDQLATLHRMEKEFGSALVAYEPTEPFAVASAVPDPELKRIQQLEKETSLFLVAYRQEPDTHFRPHSGHEVASLSEEQVKRLQRQEDDANLVLMAYKAA